ncbi:hypothetical protein [Spirulina subsalsa]|nr:hypothetical protein [Spirulina subsalsa]
MLFDQNQTHAINDEIHQWAVQQFATPSGQRWLVQLKHKQKAAGIYHAPL